MAQRRVRETLIALLAVGVVVATGAVVLVLLVDFGKPAPVASPPTSTTAPTTTSTKPSKPKRVERQPPALVVKVDNVSASRPHTGLGSADLIYVEPVEGGFTRLLATYWGRRPGRIGPVRSVRETDIELLSYMRRPVLAYSGAASRLRDVLRESNLVHATPGTTGGFYRDGSRPIPHNMYVDPGRLPKTKRVDPPLRTGKAPPDGRRVNSHRVKYRGATYDFTWSARSKRWFVDMDGRPFTSTERGQLRAGTVVVQRVRIVRGEGVKDRAGFRSPVARTVGSGRVTVLRGGRAYDGTWHRRTSAHQTTYRTWDGEQIRLTSGQVWVLLVPA